MSQSLAFRLRLQLLCAWAMEGVKGAMTLSRERGLRAHQVASLRRMHQVAQRGDLKDDKGATRRSP